ncbi:uncharacterized protein LOC117118219 [Anneissia japonica]|uniref:uncharacterized protein LOC117118219 n=1 Tax=Anneissia japonica TaxID=1529436 RepID=UPI00142590FD|nr:uncharacterized protein LOC117118219 [Anneissia japonica]
MARVRHIVCQLLLVTVIMIQRGSGWHDALGETTFHCWPLDAGDEDKNNYINCEEKGLSFSWVEKPPTTVTAEKTFEVKYSITANDKFFEWAINPDSEYARDYGIILNFSSIALAKEFCYNVSCPAEDQNTDNCCLHHVNVHSCPQDEIKGTICGPWIPPNGEIFTHTQEEVGNLASPVWTTDVALLTPGLTSIIAHIRIGNIQAALHYALEVEEAVGK